VRKPEGQTALRRPKRRLKHNIKMYVRETECDIDWIHLAQDRDSSKALLKTVMNPRVP
jgi:hypothetical protein